MAEISSNYSLPEHSSSVSVEFSSAPTVEQADINFIKKVIEHIQTLPGAETEKLKIQTNTGFPSRYVLMISNLPIVNFNDIITIETLAPQMRSMKASLNKNYLKIDMWKKNASIRKQKRKYTEPVKREWNFKSINKEDISMLTRILDNLSNISSLPCQFHTVITPKPPNYYEINITTNDTVDLKEIIEFKNKHRAFVKEIKFDFPKSIISLKIEKASANTDFNAGKRRILTVYKKNNTQ